MSKLRIVRRLGASPTERGSNANGTCPDIFELDDGRFAVVGTLQTRELQNSLPADAGLGDYEQIVVVSRDTLIRAKADIPDI